MENISLRYATRNDAKFLFYLVNDSECRKNSLNPDKVLLEEHMQWLECILNSKTQKQYILLDRGNPIGQGRLEAVGEGCRISYSIIPERRGLGYGKILIQLLNNAILKDFLDCKYSYGEVMKRNISSQKIFEELGYTVEEREDYFYYWKQVKYCNISQAYVEKRGGTAVKQ